MVEGIDSCVADAGGRYRVSKEEFIHEGHEETLREQPIIFVSFVDELFHSWRAVGTWKNHLSSVTRLRSTGCADLLCSRCLPFTRNGGGQKAGFSVLIFSFR